MSRPLWHMSQVLPMATAFAWAVACIVTNFNINSSPSKALQTSSLSAFQAEASQSASDGASLFGGAAVGAFSLMAALVMYVLNFSADKYVRTRKVNVAKSLKHRKNVVVVTACLRGVGATLGIALASFYASKGSPDYAAPAALGFLFAVSCGIAVTFTMLKIYEPVPTAGVEDQTGSSAYGALPQQEPGSAVPTQWSTIYGFQPQPGSVGNGEKPLALGQTGWQAPPPYQPGQ